MPKPTRQGGLGRGLGSLIPSEPQDTDSPLRELPIADIVPNTFQPRRRFDEEALVSLSASIRELGVLQPILVRSTASGFELIAGERRWRAAKRAGLDRIPAIVRTVDDETSLAQAIVENVQRAELNAIEEAAAFQQLIDDFDLTQDQVATRVGRSRPAVANALRLLHLPVDLQRMVVDGQLSAGHARVLVPLNPADQQAFADQVVAESLSVRALEQLVRGDGDPAGDGHASSDAAGDGPGSAAPDGRSVGVTKPPALLELEELLGDRFDTKVAISLGAKRGRIAIDFADIDDLERIYALMTDSTAD